MRYRSFLFFRYLLMASCLMLPASLLPAQPLGQGKLTVMSWNIRDLTLNNLKGARLQAICSAISVNTANITFLLEVRNSPAEIGQTIADAMAKNYSFDGSWDYAWVNVGREGSRVEYGLAIIRSESKAKIKVNDFGILDRKNQYSQPWDLHKVSAMSDAQRQREGPAYVGNRVPFYLDVSVERPGLSSFREVLSSWHAPGPNNNPADLWQVFKPAMQKEGIGVSTGDYNSESFNREVVRPSGTTVGGHDFDGGVVLDQENYRMTDIRSVPDIDFTMTDHLPALMTFEVGRKDAPRGPM